MVAVKDLKRVAIGAPIDIDIDDDDGVRTIAGDTIAYDPSKVVTNVSADPRGSKFEKQPVPNGPQVLPATGPLVGRTEPQVKQLKQVAQDVSQSEFLKDLGLNPEDYGITDIPFDTNGPPVVMNRTKEPPAAQGDVLEQARRRALHILKVLPAGCELFVGGGEGHEAVELAMGLGLLIGSGLAVYRGDGHYRLSDKGRIS